MYTLSVLGAMERIRFANVLQLSQPCPADTFKVERSSFQGVLVQYPSELMWQNVHLHPHSGFLSNAVSVMVGTLFWRNQDCGSIVCKNG
jgi:hypothetical protein